jgi:hypothetical protein
MANWSDPRTTAFPRPTTVGVGEAAYDAGLRSYMLSVYNYMASGVLLTGIVALMFSMGGVNSPAAQLFMHGGILKWVVMLAPLGIVFFLGFRVHTLSLGTARALYWAFAIVMGLSMSTIFLVYTGASIAQTFFATAAAFVSLSLYGYTTKKDLSGFGTFLIMGVVGLLIAMVINIFLQSSVMSLVISAIGVLLFAGLTAYDTQKIKSMYFAVQGSEFIGKSAVMGALTLYLDFINMFTFMLQFMGDRR